MPKDRYGDDDGRVIADMSEVERTPILMPRFGRKDGTRADFQDPGEEGPDSRREAQAPVTVTREERRALIKGGIAAGLVVVAALAAGFAALIFLINLLSR